MGVRLPGAEFVEVVVRRDLFIRVQRLVELGAQALEALRDLLRLIRLRRERAGAHGDADGARGDRGLDELPAVHVHALGRDL